MKIDQKLFSIATIKDSYRPLKIAQVAPPWFSVPPKHYGGTESVISNLSEEQVKQGHQVTVFASGDSYTSGNLKYYLKKSLSEQGIPWSDPTEAYYHLLSSFREIKQHVEDYDIVHIHLSSASDLILFQLVSQLKVPHICTLHSRFPFDRREKYRGEGDKYYFSFSENTPLIAISNRARENALRESGLPLNVVGVIPHGLPDNQFLFGGDISERHNLVWIGRITRDKGTKYAVEAAIKAKRKIILAGIVDTYLPESVDYFYQEVLPLIEANPDYAEYIGPVTNGERLKLLKSGFCFLNPIEWEEPFGLVMIEAMACGCPVISYKRGAAQELIKPGINGDFAASVDEMVAKIEAVGNSINRRQMIRDTWNNYSVTTMAERYDMKYRELIDTQIKGQLDRAYSLSGQYLKLTHS
ncbi:MAG TPA: glycosyltransferase family 4 protein [Cyanobacteria bacterium UBA8803]|nr:glycosyltransferase family 4 protein [Cyanobacteria bacterium UBA9273]HBL61839.1 glycosyltransferase family 4 protein [Cyanobacteria bacterium UBA8803]